MRYWLVMRGGYVIARVVWDGVTPWTYPYPHDELIEDVEKKIGIGNWYDKAEEKFKRPGEGPAPTVPSELLEG